jgi:1-phosphofructokinase family hexose kinase
VIPAERGQRLLFVAANPSVDRLYELDRLELGAIARPRSTTVVPGGKGLNAARAAAALGGDVTAIAILGGASGDWIADRMAALPLVMRVVPSAAETRTCISLLDRSSGALTEVYEPGTEINVADWEALESAVVEELGRGDVAAIAVSGSLPPGAPVDGYGRLTRLGRAAARPVPMFADTHGSALASVLAERPAIVKVNATEAAEASGVAVVDAASAGSAADRIRSLGADMVVVTLGVSGAVVVGDGERSSLVPAAMVGAYPVGSGDAFLGGLVVAAARGDTTIDAARQGMAAAIANAQVPGAGELDPRGIARILEAITLEPL